MASVRSLVRRPADAGGPSARNPSVSAWTGREVGGDSNDYDYTDADPVNALDLDGRFSVRGHFKSHWKTYLGAAASFVPVAGQIVMAYRAYKVARFVYSSGRAGAALARSRRLGELSRLTGDVHRGATAGGRLNSGRVRLGWSAVGSRAMGLGKGSARQAFRIGVGRSHRTLLYGRWL